MRYDPEAVAVAFQRLFRTYRFVEADEADEMLRVYFEAVTDYETQDIEAGVADMLAGRVDGFNPSFLPPAPLVGKAVRDAMNRRLDSEARRRASQPKLPPPDVEKSPESQARVLAIVADIAAKWSVSEELRSDSAMLKRAAERHDEYFQPTLNYRTGDPEGNIDAGEAA